MQFTKSKGYLTVQATEEGYFYIFYDSDLHEINAGDYDNPDISVQKATYEILKSERMDDLECVKVDYKEFEAMTIQHSKDLLQAGELRATSEIGRDEAALNLSLIHIWLTSNTVVTRNLGITISTISVSGFPSSPITGSFVTGSIFSISCFSRIGTGAMIWSPFSPRFT